MNPPHITLTPEISPEDKQIICKNLYGYNVEKTERLLQKPGVDIQQKRL